MKLEHLALSLLVGLAAPLTLAPTGANAQPKKAAPAKPAPKKGEPSANEVATNVQKFYDKTKSFKAGFKQRYWVKAYNKTKDSKGGVIFQKPGKMSWRYTNNGNRVVSDGKNIKVYEAENKQMYEQTMGKSQYPAALAFLVGGGNLRKEFKLRKLNSKQMKFEGGYVLEGIPKKATPAYNKLLLYVDANTYQVRRVLLLDAQGNRNRFDFLTPSVNEKVPAGEFNFKPPPGTQVIKP
ncbi:MAG: outer membrane lipoprotein carrier protein LolA [Myxococcales bacterium]|nr:outer membrane lipoprotein carrier protein LolA [Myxococcales bacterium]MCB9579515.1 outer membrane lipoprotein carrier protein LolA [Polyangiaceae bacterium]